uniref:Laminin subunit beta-1 n=1 Tax=Syphacia muris TaxID=451379 RepID=A0A0N5AN25_9BILA
MCFVDHYDLLVQEDTCRDSSCYPETGNLLIGRKKQLSATSTCGLHRRERYCIVSHLEENTKCFYCDSRQEWRPFREPYKLSHRIENVVSESYEDSTRSWWQSENGVQNVSIRFDLEAEFHFTHLIMTFKSFRPAAMIIERSADFGKTWKPYRYFAYDCANTFPNIPPGPPQKHTDVICTRKYSEVAPSTGGELVYKVISPHIPTEDPYAKEISNLLKITNLRINFTKLHTLGDDLLDYRPEIDQKYYYAVYEMVIRGSCSCYGHAQRCIPIDGSSVLQRPDMVHGRCECTHNTKGFNCEKCKDFYNDLPWRPAIGEETHECKRCNCNHHAATCHFDQKRYEESGYVSGGVCDNCSHNTQGQHCEECIPYYYRDPQKKITDRDACIPCNCDRAGSDNNGICESEENPERGLVAGRCYCKKNVDGPRCDRCKNGFWNLSSEDPNGCKACTCNLLGTYNNEGCNKKTGECLCKRLVTGENCDQCLPQHYGLSDDFDGCKPCDCDIGGAYDNDCDVISGQCKCKKNFSGRRCDTAENSFYCANIDHYTYEAENAQITYGDSIQKEPPLFARDRKWTGEGIVRVFEDSTISFTVNNLAQSMRYAIDHYGWDKVEIAVIRSSNPDSGGPCADVSLSDDFLFTRLHPDRRYVEVTPDVCLEEGKSYEIRLHFGRKHSEYPDRTANVFVDSIILVPPTDALQIFQGSYAAERRREEFTRYHCRSQALGLTPLSDMSDVCLRYICPIAGAVLNESLKCDCDVTGSVSSICAPKGGQCECKPNVVGRRCDRCAVETFGFGPSGCTACECDSVGSLNNVCDKQSGQCFCRERGITGRQCNQCQPGFWDFPTCRVCQCNNHASTCDQVDGTCIDCLDLTDGRNCERCKNGYYGDPRLGANIPCKPCRCPGGPDSGFQHADSCYLRSSETMEFFCNCREGYVGERCNQCAVNYWGNPTEVGGTCERCDCNGNIDFNVPGSCDATTGDCIKCLYNTEGPQCEHCIEGYFGEARYRSCERCVCNKLGTNRTAGACDRVTGQCVCLPNVQGKQCDSCAPYHYNLASGQGCEPCNCDPTGVVSRHDGTPELQCNLFDGRCPSECEDFYWGDPKAGECNRCECDPIGSASQQCHRTNGTCICLSGYGGALCNECARGYTGEWPNCKACGECFTNWDNIIQQLKKQVDDLIERANSIEDTGVTSVYDDAFERIENTIKDVRVKLESANITKQDVENLQAKTDELSKKIALAKEDLSKLSPGIIQATASIDSAREDMEKLLKKAENLSVLAQDLNEKATLLRETDAEGAYNITQEAANRSAAAKERTAKAVEVIESAERERAIASSRLEKNQMDFQKQFEENEAALKDIDKQISVLQGFLPGLNKDVCGAETPHCDELCGGPGDCGHCGGGGSCLQGSVTKAEQALMYANETSSKLDEKEADADGANNTKLELQKILNETNEFLSEDRSSPEQIRIRAEEVLNKKISLAPEQIQELANQIRDMLKNINNIDDILAETQGNKSIAANLQETAEAASRDASSIRNETKTVSEALTNADKTQKSAQAAINAAKERISQAKDDIGKVDEETKAAEELVNVTKSALENLENEMQKIRLKYLEVSKEAGRANLDASDVMEKAGVVESEAAI